jgi:hypothetical protein
MRNKRLGTTLLALGLVVGLTLVANLSAAQGPGALAGSLQEGAALLAGAGTAFTYQGRLTDGGGPAQGRYDLEFVVYAEPGGGRPLEQRRLVTLTWSTDCSPCHLISGTVSLKGTPAIWRCGYGPGTARGPTQCSALARR